MLTFFGFIKNTLTICQNWTVNAVDKNYCSFFIQAFYRGMVERRRFQHQRASAAIIQERFRAHLLCQRERAKYLEMKKSAVLIQVSNQSTTTANNIPY